MLTDVGFLFGLNLGVVLGGLVVLCLFWLRRRNLRRVGVISLVLLWCAVLPVYAGGETLQRSWVSASGDYKMEVWGAENDPGHGLRYVCTELATGDKYEALYFIAFGEVQEYHNFTRLGIAEDCLNQTYIAPESISEAVSSVIDALNLCRNSTTTEEACNDCAHDILGIGIRAAVFSSGGSSALPASMGVAFANYINCDGTLLWDDSGRGRLIPDCMDDKDNDGDNKCDWAGCYIDQYGWGPHDPGCSGPGDWTEGSEGGQDQCADGEDNDDDGCEDGADMGCIISYWEEAGPCVGPLPF